MKINQQIATILLLFALFIIIGPPLSRIRVDLLSIIPQSTECQASPPKEELQQLRRQVVLLSWQLLQLKEKLNELTTFREKFSIDKIPYAIPATILIRRDSSNQRRSFVINKGKRDGISVGDPVVYGYTLVGRIIEIGKAASRALHVADPAMSISIRVLGMEKGKIVHYGEGLCKGGKGCTLQFVEKGYQRWNANKVLVVTSGFNGQYPPGLVIGEVLLPGQQKKQKQSDEEEDSTSSKPTSDAGLFWNLPVQNKELEDLNTILVMRWKPPQRQEQ